MTHFLTSEVTRHGYAAVFVLMLLESACIPIPSEVIMLFGGALAGGLLASGHAHVGLVGVALAGAVGNLAGSLLAYWVGRAGGRALLERYGRYLLIRPEHLDRAERFFARRGSLAVLIGRVLPVVRTFISLPAGVAEMPIWRFSAYTLAGCLPWTFGLAAGGDALASHWRSVASAFTPASIVIAVLIVAGIGWWAFRRLQERRHEPAAQAVRSPEEG